MRRGRRGRVAARKPASARGLVLLERDGALRGARLVPDAQSHLRLGAEVARDPQRLAGVARMRREELDELRALRRRAPRAEAEPLLDRPAALGTRAHRFKPMPGPLALRNPYDPPVRDVPNGSSGCPSSTSPRCSAASRRRRRGGRSVVDLGRGNPEVGPPEHVVEAPGRAAARGPGAHGYAPIRGPAGAEGGDRRALPHGLRRRGRPRARGRGRARDEDGARGVRAGDRRARRDDPPARSRLPGLPLGASRSSRRAEPRAAARPGRAAALGRGAAEAAALYLNYPSNPAAVAAPEGVFEEAVACARRSGAWVLHDFAYGDLVFDGRRPASFLAADGAREVGVEFFSMSKTLRDGRLAARLRARERGGRRGGSSCCRTTSSPGSSGRCRRRGSRR